MMYEIRSLSCKSSLYRGIDGQTKLETAVQRRPTITHESTNREVTVSGDLERTSGRSDLLAGF